MRDHRLDGKFFGTEFFDGGFAQITGTGTGGKLVAAPGDARFPIEVRISPAWPPIYFNTRTEAIAFANPRGGTFVEHVENITPVRWFVGTEPRLAFADLSDVMLYAQASNFGRD
jgi:hypothetical protein